MFYKFQKKNTLKDNGDKHDSNELNLNEQYMAPQNL